MPALPAAAVCLAQSEAAAWLNAAGIPATVVSEAALPDALNNAVLAVIPVQEVRQAATVDALKAHLARGGRVLATYWGPVGARSSVDDALAALLNVNVTGWSGKGNAAIVPGPTGRAFFGPLASVKTGRPYAVVAAPVIPPPPPPPPAPPAPVAPPAPKPAPAPPAKPANSAAAAKPAAPAPVTPPAPPPPPPGPPPPAAVGRWVGDDGRPARKSPADAAAIFAPGTLWIGEDIFLKENDTPDMRRWLVTAAVALAPTLRLPAKQATIGSAQAWLDSVRSRIPAVGADPGMNVAEAQRAVQAATQALAKAAADMDHPTVLADVATARAALLEADAALTPSRPVEVRAVRIEQANLPKDLGEARRLVQRLVDARFNVILPEVVSAGSAAYPSAVYPQDRRFAGADPLRILADEARRRGMEVYPWVWTLAAGRNGEQGLLLRKHPEWAARDKAGRIMTDSDGMFWLSPSIPAARLAVRNVVREIVARYDVDGIHLDYLRLPNPYYDYSGAAREAFRKQGGGDPMDIPPLSPAAAAWHAWREAQITSLVAEISADIRSMKPRLGLSATVAATPEQSRREHLQDWPNWAVNRWVDWVVPAISVTDASEAVRLLELNLAAAGPAFIVPAMTTSLAPDTGAASPLWAAVQATPALGAVFLSADRIGEDAFRSLRLGAFRAPAVTPWKNPARPAPPAPPERPIAPTAPPVATVAHPLPMPSARVPVAMGGIVVDGRPDDAAWNGAATLQLDHAHDGNRAPLTTTVRLLRDAGALYIAFSCPEPNIGGLRATQTGRDAPVYADDSVEVFLSPSEFGLPYYHFIVGAGGGAWDDKSGDSRWGARWNSAVARDGDGWSVEIAIPFSSLESAPEGRWRANFARNRLADGPHYLTWSVPYGNYHAPDRFGALTF